MKVDIKKLPKSEVQLTISVPYDVYKKWEKKAIEELGKEIKVAGFRSGHIPEEVIREKVHAEGVRSATLDFVFPQTYSQAVTDNKIEVIARPKVEIKSDIQKEGDEFVYVATVAVMPEVKVGDYKKIKVARKPVVVEPKSVEDTIKMVMDRYAEWKDVERKAQKGDRAEVDFEGFDEQGNPIPNTASKNHPIVLGSGVMVPGFEDAILGMVRSESKEFSVQFPKDYHAKPMQGKTVKFKLVLNRLEEKTEQALDEAMIEKITGKKQSVEEFRKAVEEDLKSELVVRNQQEHDNAVVAEIIKITKVDLPEAMVEQEIDMMLEDQKERVKQQGIQWEDFLKRIGKSDADFRKDHAKGAGERVLARLGVQFIIRDSKLEVTDEDLNKKIEELVARYPEEQRKMARDHYEKDAEARRHLRHNMSADKLIDMLSK
ncbi:trigger factor [Candidatus Peregrinibacteria bacterium]|nr:trigger factor [Candidatus Peregrinibacteria bacterium]